MSWSFGEDGFFVWSDTPTSLPDIDAPLASPTMAADLRAIVLAMAARSMANPAAAKRLQAGNYTEVPANPGPLLHERLVLDSYRTMAA